VTNGSLVHAHYGSNLSTLHPLISQSRDLLITSLALGLTSLLRTSFGSRSKIGLVARLRVAQLVQRSPQPPSLHDEVE
jgi:hypothetical protein